MTRLDHERTNRRQLVTELRSTDALDSATNDWLRIREKEQEKYQHIARCYASSNSFAASCEVQLREGRRLTSKQARVLLDIHQRSGQRIKPGRTEQRLLRYCGDDPMLVGLRKKVEAGYVLTHSEQGRIGGALKNMECD